MKNNLKIAIIGGTGKSGTYLVHQLITQSIPFKILVRNRDRLQVTSPLMEVVTGDVNHYSSVLDLLQGCDAILSTLGYGIPPSEPSIFSKATQQVLRAMKECKVKRYMVITGLHVDTPFDTKSAKTKQATEWMRTNYPITTVDRQLEYDMLTTSEADWTLVRLPFIELTDRRSPVSVSLEDCLGDKISATDLACFLLEQLSYERYSRQAPFLANI